MSGFSAIVKGAAPKSSKWDLRFLELARLVSGWSKDPSTQTGAAIIRPDGTIESVGYNGFPKGLKDDPEILANRELKYSRTVHCEINAIISARGPVAGCTLYTWPFLTCDRCSTIVIQSGIRRVVTFEAEPDKLSRWGDAFRLAKSYYEEAGVDVCEYIRPAWVGQ